MSKIDLRLGDWRDVMDDVECDALVTDPPYGARTHTGHDHSAEPDRVRDGVSRRPLCYKPWSRDDVEQFVRHWHERTSSWLAIMSCSNLIPEYQRAFDLVGRVSFQPVPCVIRAMTVRMAGDGPSSWAVYLNVARRKTKDAASWGTLPGAYVTSRGSGQHIGGKPMSLVSAIVRDYSRPGDLVCDPCAGYATTGLAASSLGRRFVGAELDPETHSEGAKRLSGMVQQDMFT